jgi:DNA (cytosine-5)-methyltransferase 1
MHTAISLFSGLGGDSLGMKQAGVHVIAYNELKSQFCESHNANFPDCELIREGNTTDISKLSDECFQKYAGKVDIVFAGFPCQGFSTAGKKKDDDPRNTMFREFLRFVAKTCPWMIIGENVKGLLTKKTSSGEMYIDVIVSEFQQLGYTVIYKVFKTDQYGVPQKRERLIILGVKLDNPYGWQPQFPEPQPGTPNLQSIIQYNMTGAVKVGQDTFMTTIPDECIITNMEDQTEYPDNNGGHPYLLSKLNATEQDRSYDGKQHTCLFSFGKRDSPIHCEIIDIRNPSKTIICTYEHQPRLFVPVKNTSGCYLRMLLPDELKQIQGFPLEHIVCGSNKDKIIQIGNAVPPPLICAIVRKVIS